MDIEKIAEEMAAAIMKKSGQKNDGLKSTIPIKRVNIRSDEFKEGVKNFRHVQGLNALVEEHEPDAYLDHILFLRCTDQITDSDARKVSNEYIKTGKKLI